MPPSWRKSSHSTSGANCVEVAVTPATVLVRDSKDTARPHIQVGSGSWDFFQRGVASGKL
jgi:hypothetical protein